MSRASVLARVLRFTAAADDPCGASTGCVEVVIRYAYGFEDARDAGGNGWVGKGGVAPGMNGDLRIYPKSGYAVACWRTSTRRPCSESRSIRPPAAHSAIAPGARAFRERASPRRVTDDRCVRVGSLANEPPQGSSASGSTCSRRRAQWLTHWPGGQPSCARPCGAGSARSYGGGLRVCPDAEVKREADA